MTRRYRDDDFIGYTGVPCPCPAFDWTQDNGRCTGNGDMDTGDFTIKKFKKDVKSSV